MGGSVAPNPAEFLLVGVRGSQHGSSRWVEDEGGVAVFRLVRGEDQRFLTLWNMHNGYYSHGFEMETNGETVRSGCL